MEAVVALVGGIILVVVLVRAFRLAGATARRIEDEAAEWTMPIAKEQGRRLSLVESNHDDPGATTQTKFPKPNRFGRVHPILSGMRFTRIRMDLEAGATQKLLPRMGSPIDGISDQVGDDAQPRDLALPALLDKSQLTQQTQDRQDWAKRVHFVSFSGSPLFFEFARITVS